MAEICGEIEARCTCIKDPGHVDAGDPVHECDREQCGGAWQYDGDTFVIVRLPILGLL